MQIQADSEGQASITLFLCLRLSSGPTGSQHLSLQTVAAHLAMHESLACAKPPAPLPATSTQFHSHMRAHRAVCGGSLGGRRCWHRAQHGGHRTNAFLLGPLTGLWITCFLLLWKRRAGWAVALCSRHTLATIQLVHNVPLWISPSLPLSFSLTCSILLSKAVVNKN